MIRIYTNNEWLANNIADAFLEADELMKGLKDICQKYNLEQDPVEIFWLVAMLSEVESVLEIGVSTGSIAMWTFLIPEGRFYIGVNTEAVLLPDPAYTVGRQVDVITGDSHKEETIKGVESLLQSRKVDLLFIDGDHSYLGMKADYENYIQFVRKGGVIAFHKYNEKHPNVHRFFKELKGRKESFTGKNGIGLLFK